MQPWHFSHLGSRDSAIDLNRATVGEFPTPPLARRQLRIAHRRLPENEPAQQVAMVTLAHCAEITGLDSSELFVNSEFSPKHKSLLLSYVLNLNHGPGVVREMIVEDIRAAIDLGAIQRAADLLLVLRVFLFEHPQARITRRPRPSGRRRSYRDFRARRMVGHEMFD